MKKIINNIIVSTLAAVIMCLPILSVNVLAASPADEACNGIKAAGGTCDKSEAAGTNAVGGIMKTIVSVLSMIVGSVSVIMIIVGGIRFVISGGDSNGVSSAKKTILYAIVGLVIALLAQVIISFIYSKATSVSAPKSQSSKQAPFNKGYYHSQGIIRS